MHHSSKASGVDVSLCQVNVYVFTINRCLPLDISTHLHPAQACADGSSYCRDVNYLVAIRDGHREAKRKKPQTAYRDVIIKTKDRIKPMFF